MTADFTEKEASAAAEEDWIEDAKGQDSLARQGFMDGIFHGSRHAQEGRGGRR